MSDDPNILGYCGVIVPVAKFWQGYFLDRRLLPHAQDIMARLRAHPTWGVRTLTALPGTDEQELVGALCAVLVESALTDDRQFVGACAVALSLVMDNPYFLVVGDRRAEGTQTTFERLDVSSIDEARALIDSDPRVAALKQALLDDLKKPRN